MVDPINMLPMEGWAYKITDRPCTHHKDGRHKGDCSVCTREVLVEAVEAKNLEIRLLHTAIDKSNEALLTAIKDAEDLKAARLQNGVANEMLSGTMEILMKIVDSEKYPIAVRCDAQELLRRWQRGEYLKQPERQSGLDAHGNIESGLRCSNSGCDELATCKKCFGCKDHCTEKRVGVCDHCDMGADGKHKPDCCRGL